MTKVRTNVVVDDFIECWVWVRGQDGSCNGELDWKPHESINLDSLDVGLVSSFQVGGHDQ